MEFLSRSWSVSAFEISKALAPQPPQLRTKNSTITAAAAPGQDDGGGGGVVGGGNGTIQEDVSAEFEAVSGNPFAFACSETSQLVMDRIMSHSVSWDMSLSVADNLFFSCVCGKGIECCLCFVVVVAVCKQRV